MKFLKFLDDNFEKYVCIFFLVLMVFATTCQIIFRTTGLPLSWTEELARYSFIWLIYVSCSYAIKLERHIKIEAVMLLFGKRGRLVLNIISDILFFIFAVVVSYYGFLMLQRLLFITKQKSPAMQISMGLPYSAIFFGCVLMSVRLIQHLFKIVQEYKTEKGLDVKTRLNDPQQEV